MVEITRASYFNQLEDIASTKHGFRPSPTAVRKNEVVRKMRSLRLNVENFFGKSNATDPPSQRKLGSSVFAHL
jgi:hypothetical protein